MSALMGRPPLFRQDYTGEAKPKKFGFLLRPTRDEFNAFIQLLEKMLSGNINVDFFMGEVELEYLEKRKGKPDVAKPKGTVTVLKEWLDRHFRADDNEWIDKMFVTFRKIIKMRQEPAHAVREDVFNQQYFRQQRDLVLDAYFAVSTLRMAFHGHPKVAGHEVPEHLVKGEIWKE
jgi:hypothetical protein